MRREDSVPSLLRMAASRTMRKQEILRRIYADNENFIPACTILDPSTGKLCGRPTMRAAKQGLAAFHCRYHVEHYARHGSHWHPSYRAADLKPYLTAASEWIEVNREEFFVKAALKALDGLLQCAGPATISTRLRGLSPHERAKIALGRIREAGIKPERLLAIHLAISALIDQDPGSHRVREFCIVQVAKAAHRLASGYHARWNVPQHDGTETCIELHAYPRSSGRVLRHLGEMIERECELVADKHLQAVLAFKVSRYGPHPTLPKNPSVCGTEPA